MKAADGILFLSLTDADGQTVTSDCWVAGENDEYDWKKANWYETPINVLGSYRGLNDLPSEKVTVKVGRYLEDNGNDIDLMLINHTCRVAYCTELVAVDAKGMPVPYAFFTDNYFSLLPHEHRTVRLHCPADSRAAAVKVRTWNTGEQTVKLSR